MQPHEERVVKELEELEDRINKLQTFVNSEKMDTLDETDQVLLVSQVSAMVTYAGILMMRVARFK